MITRKVHQSTLIISCSILCVLHLGQDHDNVKFARTFLENLFAGLSLDHPQTSRKEFEVQLRTFRECLLYLMAGLDHQLPQMGYFIGGAFDKVSPLFVVYDACCAIT